MNDNPLVKEIRKHREAILASHGGDYLAMMEAMGNNQWNSGHEIVAPPAKKANASGPAPKPKQKGRNTAKAR